MDHASIPARSVRPMILLVDNYDSFVYNLARYLEELGEETLVARNDAVSVPEIRALSPEAIVLSPGPCAPPQAGVCLDAVRELGSGVPILGVCLGHQVVGAAYGATVSRGHPMHGRASPVFHGGGELFRGIPTPFTAARYHSLVVLDDGLPPVLEVTARTADGTIMALHHRSHPVSGVQFHPESVLTEHGHQLLGNFLALARSARGALEHSRCEIP